jgi:YD repeat-containing protein
VSSITREGVTYAYSYADSGTTRTTIVTDPVGGQRVYVSDTAASLIRSYRDELGRRTDYEYDSNGRVTRVTLPEGNVTLYSYDPRGNLVQARNVAKPGSGLADIVTSAVYEAGCSNQKTCNKPVSTTDPRGNVTDYSYDPAHGGLTAVTLPAGSNGVRPQTRYAYTLTNGVYLLSSTSACQTQASCAGTADEVKSSIGYGTNLLPVSVSSGAGDNSLTATSTMSYDNIGNLVSVDGPLPGSADTMRTRYDAARRVVGTVSPDPDGSGPLNPRAVRTSYNADGQAVKLEQGNVADQSDAAWAGFSPLQEVQTDYDANARPTVQRLVAGGTVHALSQTSYDALGRPECSATRMNPAAFGSLRFVPLSCWPMPFPGGGAPRLLPARRCRGSTSVHEARGFEGVLDHSLHSAPGCGLRLLCGFAALVRRGGSRGSIQLCGRNAEEFGDENGGVEADVQHVGACRADRIRLAAGERDAVRHSGDQIMLDERLAGRSQPGAAREAPDRVQPVGIGGKPVHVHPLPDDRIAVARHNRMIGTALPDLNAGPGALVVGSAANAPAEFVRAALRAPAHAVERLTDVGRAAVSDAGQDGACREDLRIGGQHHRGHRSAGAEAGHEDAAGIDVVEPRHAVDHRADRGGLAASAPGILDREPVEAQHRVVGPLLLGKEEDEAVPVGERGPAGAVIVDCGILGAAVEHDHDRGRALETFGHIVAGAQIAGIGAEIGEVRQSVFGSAGGGEPADALEVVVEANTRRNNRH